MSLPTPYYETPDGAITLYHGDCREILPEIERGSVDLVLTDPPYGLGKKMSGGTWGKREQYGEMWEWDKETCVVAVECVLSLHLPTILWGGNYYQVPPSRCWLSWSKINVVRTMASMELAWTSFDKPSKEWRGPVGVHSAGHPTQKPLQLMEWCLQIAGEEAQTIIDPFAGSGTTLVAARNLGRRAIGIEIEERYCEITAGRLGALTEAHSDEPLLAMMQQQESKP